jgi:hypothetical protein
MRHQSIDEMVALLAPLRTEQPPAGPYARATTDAYEAMSGDVLRQSHAHQAAERPHASATYAHGDSAMCLWTKPGPDGASWTALVTSATRNREGTVLNAGYRVLTDSPDEAVALADDPALALATLLSRFGVSYYTGTKRVYFVPEQVVELSGRLEALGPNEFARTVGLETPPDGSRVAVNVDVARGEEGHAALRWLFVLDVTRYAEASRPPRR